MRHCIQPSRFALFFALPFAAAVLAAPAAAQPAPSAELTASARFSGQATIAQAAAASSTGRFQLDAAMSSAPPAGDGRYRFSAKLSPDPSAITGSCAAGGDAIFSSGFE